MNAEDFSARFTSSQGRIVGQVRQCHSRLVVWVAPCIGHRVARWHQAQPLPGSAWPPPAPPVNTRTQPPVTPQLLAQQHGRLGPQRVREAGEARLLESSYTRPGPQQAFFSVEGGGCDEVGAKIRTRLQPARGQGNPALQRWPQQTEARSVRERVRSIFVSKVSWR